MNHKNKTVALDAHVQRTPDTLTQLFPDDFAADAEARRVADEICEYYGVTTALHYDVIYLPITQKWTVQFHTTRAMFTNTLVKRIQGRGFQTV